MEYIISMGWYVIPFLIVLSILVFVSVIQTVTLANVIGKKPAPTTDSGTSSNANPNPPAGGANLPAALKNIPQQQGGC